MNEFLIMGAGGLVRSESVFSSNCSSILNLDQILLINWFK